MNVKFNVNYAPFMKLCEVAINKVQRGTKKATIEACKEILADSLTQVPRETDTLARSAFYEVEGNYANFTGIIGYGGNGDPVNPKTGLRASEYMVVVHEDLSANHPTGKAKFLEDPVRAYHKKFATKASRIIRSELNG